MIVTLYSNKTLLTLELTFIVSSMCLYILHNSMHCKLLFCVVNPLLTELEVIYPYSAFSTLTLSPATTNRNTSN